MNKVKEHMKITRGELTKIMALDHVPMMAEDVANRKSTFLEAIKSALPGEGMTSWCIKASDAEPIPLPDWFQLPIDKTVAEWSFEHEKWQDRQDRFRIRHASTGKLKLAPKKQEEFEKWKKNGQSAVILLHKVRSQQVARCSEKYLQKEKANLICFRIHFHTDPQQLGLSAGTNHYKLCILKGIPAANAIPTEVDAHPGWHRYRLAFLGASQTQVEVLEPLPLDLQVALAHVLPLGHAGVTFDASVEALQFWQSGSPPKCWEQLPALMEKCPPVSSRAQVVADHMQPTGGHEGHHALLPAVRQVLRLHGGALPASILGDELRRRSPELWKAWKSKGESSLVRLCATAEGFSVEGVLSSHAEPLIRCDTSISGGYLQADDQIGGGPEANPLNDQGKLIYNAEPEDVAEKLQEVRKALSGRMLRHPEGSNGGPVPVAWLTVACEKELLRHIRLFPRYEQEIVQRLPHLADCLSECTCVTVTSETGKAVRKKRMAYRLVALISEVTDTFQITVLDDLLKSQVTLLKPSSPDDALVSPEHRVGRPSQLGEGRRAWRRSLPEMPGTGEELLCKLEALRCEGEESDETELWLLLLRNQGSRSKEAQLMALEFQTAAMAVGVASRHLQEIAPGMLALRVSQGHHSPAAAFLTLVPGLVSVRRSLRLWNAFGTPEDLGQGVQELLASREVLSWWLDVELREGPVNAASLPLKRSHGAEVVLKVISKVAASLYGMVPKLREAREDPQHLQLVLLEAQGGAYLLSQELVDHRQNRSSMSCALPAACHEAWLKRPFHFSAGLDSWVANAVLSLAIMEFQGRHGRNPSTLLDPCCGSGTLAAMAAASGIFSQVFARDVDEPFLQRVRENFAHLSTQVGNMSAIDVGFHDAATPFDLLKQPDIVIANPPWGWRIGLARTASTEEILTNLLHQFPRAIVAVICPELPTQLGQFQVRSSCALGQSAVWILTPGEEEKVPASHRDCGWAQLLMLATVL
eukprot:s8_g47.t1